MAKRTFDIDLPEEMWARLDRLAEASPNLTSVDELVSVLLDHAQQGVYRSGAWERNWLSQCMGPDVVEAAYDPAEDPINRRPGG